MDAPQPNPDLKPVGVYPGPDSFHKEKVDTRKLMLGKAKSLHDLTDQYSFYTPALIYLNVPLRTDLLPAYNAECGTDIIPFSVVFNDPLFTGLEAGFDHSWNHVLYAMENEYWPNFLAWMGSVALSDPSKRILYRIRTQEVSIADPLDQEADDLWITAFVLDTNVGCTVFKKDHIFETRPEAVYMRDLVYQDTKQMAEAIFSGMSDPYKESQENQNASKDPSP